MLLFLTPAGKTLKNNFFTKQNKLPTGVAKIEIWGNILFVKIPTFCTIM